MFYFSKNSKQLLDKGVHPDLVKLANEVIKITPIDFSITETYRSNERQKQLYKQGKSKCDGVNIKSKHQIQDKSGCVEAIDICPYINNKLDYEATNDLFIIVGLFIAKAKELNINIIVGALWDNDSVKNNSFVDGGHIELRD